MQAYYDVRLTTTVRFTLENIQDLMATALEGGIGYWACLDNTSRAYEEAPPDEPVAITCANELWRGNDVCFYDVENDEKYVLTLTMLLNGFRLWYERGNDRYKAVGADGDVDWCQIDAPTADEIIQYAIFGQLIFG